MDIGSFWRHLCGLVTKLQRKVTACCFPWYHVGTSVPFPGLVFSPKGQRCIPSLMCLPCFPILAACKLR